MALRCSGLFYSKEREITYSTNPEQDAARHIDAAASEDDARRALSSAIRDDIMTAFTAKTRDVGPNNAVLMKPKRDSWEFTTVYEQALDLLMYEQIGELFAKVLHLSDCPHVSELRKAMGEEYASMWVDDLVEGEM